MQGRSSRPIPPALKPTPKPEPAQELHIVFVVPDERLHKLLQDRTYVLQPPFFKPAIIAHVVSEQWAKDKHMLESTGIYRQALLELGLVHPEDVEFKHIPLTLGWEE